MKYTEEFQKQVQIFLDEARRLIPLKEIEAELRVRNILGQSISFTDFEALFWPYLNAQLSQRWSRCCLEHSIDSKEIEQLFFKSVLDAYAEKKDLVGASHFSEAMYASNAKDDQEPLVSIIAALFRKTGVQESLDAAQIAEAFRWLAGVWEGYCNHFDNEFDDFIAQLRMRGNFTSAKRGVHG